WRLRLALTTIGPSSMMWVVVPAGPGAGAADGATVCAAIAGTDPPSRAVASAVMRGCVMPVFLGAINECRRRLTARPVRIAGCRKVAWGATFGWLAGNGLFGQDQLVLACDPQAIQRFVVRDENFPARA